MLLHRPTPETRAKSSRSHKKPPSAPKRSDFSILHLSQEQLERLRKSKSVQILEIINPSNDDPTSDDNSNNKPPDEALTTNTLSTFETQQTSQQRCLLDNSGISDINTNSDGKRTLQRQGSGGRATVLVSARSSCKTSPRKTMQIFQSFEREKGEGTPPKLTRSASAGEIMFGNLLYVHFSLLLTFISSQGGSNSPQARAIPGRLNKTWSPPKTERASTKGANIEAEHQDESENPQTAFKKIPYSSPYKLSRRMEGPLSTTSLSRSSDSPVGTLAFPPPNTPTSSPTGSQKSLKHCTCAPGSAPNTCPACTTGGLLPKPQMIALKISGGSPKKIHGVATSAGSGSASEEKASSAFTNTT